MSSPDSISPRGVPQIRTDWLADIARRLAALGLAPLRSLPEEARILLTDTVDGREWRFELIKFSHPHQTVVEFDSELWAPGDDPARPTLRAGFALTPRWDETQGSVAVVRTEIGPRAAVTFDPENWMVAIPTDPGAMVAPVPVGVEPGEWIFPAGAPGPVAAPAVAGSASIDALRGLRLRFDDLAPVIAGEAVPEVVLGAFPESIAKGVLGRLRGKRAEAVPTVVISLSAKGPLDVAWTGAQNVDVLFEYGMLLDGEAPVLAGEQLTFRGSSGALTVSGPALHVDIASAA